MPLDHYPQLSLLQFHPFLLQDWLGMLAAHQLHMELQQIQRSLISEPGRPTVEKLLVDSGLKKNERRTSSTIKLELYRK